MRANHRKATASDRDFAAYTLAEAARYLRLPAATLRSWVLGRQYPTTDGSGQFPPLIRPSSRQPPLLSFSNLIEAHVLRSLRTDHGVPVKALRSALAYAEKTLGIDHFLDGKDLHSTELETDAFYYTYAADLIEREKKSGPLFVLSYMMANHFPWNTPWRPDLVPDWQDLGNVSVDGHKIDEYLRRQEMSARAYKGFVERLKSKFPGEPFLIVRFGDHQPMFSKHIIEPGLDNVSIGRRIDAADPRYFTTYYAIDALNFHPADLASAVSGLDAAYLPLVVLEAAGVPLDATFVEQKRILGRCKGQFYLCANGAETRRFNRLLIDVGLIKQL